PSLLVKCSFPKYAGKARLLASAAETMKLKEAPAPALAGVVKVMCGSEKIHIAPVDPLSPGPPTAAVLPSAERATAAPCDGPVVPLTLPLPTSFALGWLHSPLLRRKITAAPVELFKSCALLPDTPTSAVLPSAESATDE